MDNLVILSVQDEDYTSPSVDFDGKTGDCVLEGVSFMESSDEFYQPITKWIDDFVKENNFINISIKVKYFNSSSSKIIYELMVMLKEYEDNGANIKVYWYYEEWDADMEEDILNLIEDSELEIKMISVSDL